MEVRLRWRDGRRETIGGEDGKPILDAAEAAGVSLPFGCRTGACASCTGRLLDGCVTHMRAPRALKERQRADGYILTCIATPDADCTVEVGADIQTDLVTNPWKER